MRTISEPDEIEGLLRSLTGAQRRFTNCFLQPPAARELAQLGRLVAHAAEGAASLVLHETDFDRLYFAAPETGGLLRMLACLPPTGREYVTDVLGREPEIDAMSGILASAGFAPYKVFQRMVRLATGSPAEVGADTTGVRPAKPHEAATVQRLIAAHFDARAEHIPPVEEVSAAIGEGAVWLAEEDRNLAALLFYSRTGLTTTLRYWLVIEEFRGRGHGDRLMRRYAHECASCRRFVLWVQFGNEAASRHYLRYGYRVDGMIDRIFRRPSGS